MVFIKCFFASVFSEIEQVQLANWLVFESYSLTDRKLIDGFPSIIIWLWKFLPFPGSFYMNGVGLWWEAGPQLEVRTGATYEADVSRA